VAAQRGSLRPDHTTIAKNVVARSVRLRTEGCSLASPLAVRSAFLIRDRGGRDCPNVNLTTSYAALWAFCREREDKHSMKNDTGRAPEGWLDLIAGTTGLRLVQALAGHRVARWKVEGENDLAHGL
jgi:hypothetical protein